MISFERKHERFERSNVLLTLDGWEKKTMVGFERQILVDRWVQEQKLAKQLVDGWVWAESFGRCMGGSAKTQIELMYPPKYQVPLRGRALTNIY